TITHIFSQQGKARQKDVQICDEGIDECLLPRSKIVQIEAAAP
ncbi:MAG: hypothetical protein K940chlam6_01521, partial [Chlamydiae bacterium]|nr:hypothetical protein [Chlamydiota bacterium]